MQYRLAIAILLTISTRGLATVAAAPPQVLDDRFVLEPFAAEPDVVTPIGATFDSRGRLLVIESHTHFPPAEYAGPKFDRIRMIEDTDGDGRADRFRSFFEGTNATMSLRRGPGDWIYVATRREVFRIRDTDRDDVADERQEIARLDTKGNYPHNGLGGLAFDNHGNLLFGLGENLGEPYTLIAADNSEWQGGGEGGNVFRCTIDGKQLERVATGFWNPFGICVDPFDRIFAVGNDPDASPPCRLVHVVPTGDYGFQFRYGRSGKHPLQAWDGELPGTLPMIAGTGEAPCNVVQIDNQLWVTSWGENRIERFTLRPHGASFTAERDIVVQGNHQFRPVDLAIAPDGSIYVTDWVDRSYPVHGKGRVWRLRRVDSAANDRATTRSPIAWPQPTEAEQLARLAASRVDREAMSSADPFLRQAAVEGLVRHLNDQAMKLSDFDDPRARLSYLQACRWRADDLTKSVDYRPMIEHALADSDEQVQMYAVRWIADQRLQDHQAALEQLLDSPRISPRLLEMTVAALDWLERGEVLRQYRQDYDRRLVDVVDAENKPASLRAAALQLMSVDSPLLSNDRLSKIAEADEPLLRREAARILALRADADAAEPLAKLAADKMLPAALRADAVVGLAARTDAHQQLLERLAQDTVAEVAREAARALRDSATESTPNATERNRPPVADTEAWLKLLGDGGNADAGWRVFFSARGGRCAACHSLGGRGAAVGPDLTGIAARMSRQRVLESLLQPSREIAPTYQPFALEMADGRVVSGLSLGRFDNDRKERIVAADGRETIVDVPQIEHRTALDTSIMPNGLEQGLTIEDLRDLLALLTSEQ